MKTVYLEGYKYFEFNVLKKLGYRWVQGNMYLDWHPKVTAFLQDPDGNLVSCQFNAKTGMATMTPIRPEEITHQPFQLVKIAVNVAEVVTLPTGRQAALSYADQEWFACEECLPEAPGRIAEQEKYIEHSFSQRCCVCGRKQYYPPVVRGSGRTCSKHAGLWEDIDHDSLYWRATGK